MTGILLPTPEEVAMQAATELLAMQLYKDEQQSTRLSHIDRHPTWIELTVHDRDEYRKLATELLINEHKQPWDE